MKIEISSDAEQIIRAIAAGRRPILTGRDRAQLDDLAERGYITLDHSALDHLGVQWIAEHPVSTLDYATTRRGRTQPARNTITVEPGLVHVALEVGSAGPAYSRTDTSLSLANALSFADAVREAAIKAAGLTRKQRTAMVIVAAYSGPLALRGTAPLAPNLRIELEHLKNAGLVQAGGYTADGDQHWTATADGLALARAYELRVLQSDLNG